MSGNIEGRWADEKVLIRLVDQRVVELPAPLELEGQFDVGDDVTVYFEDNGGGAAGWMLADRKLGVNMRGMDAPDG